MGDLSCMGCKKIEETIYWSHFQTVQFFQILSGSHYDHQLALPKKFAENLRGKLAGTVSLKGPSGSVWKVGLEADGDDLYLKHGWKTFVQEHSLQKNDVLVFKYHGNLQFDVLVFDQLSLCEKEASYFVKQCAHTEIVVADKKDKTAPPRTIRFGAAISESSDEEVTRIVVRKKPRKDVVPKQVMNQYSGKPRNRPADSSGPSSSRVGLSLRLDSKRRPVTEEEKDKVIQAATVASFDNSLTVIMRECHVYTGFYLTIPVDWSRKHLPQANFEACLRVKDKAWMAKCYYRRTMGGHGISRSGWKYFALQNHLEMDDVCVFDMVSRSNKLCIFDVRIFRVVDDVAHRKAIAWAPSLKEKGGRLKKHHPEPMASP
ncbi:unnamed protein product [Cuscuta campestris]|uniref:TF-B3 domain-containing protein n=1 Tax=Cuscuta campestris TaxID=132261 RepID=A0A484MEE4_9ASTE|nr:unnamed protein product [Cuscuta campestris]